MNMNTGSVRLLHPKGLYSQSCHRAVEGSQGPTGPQILSFMRVDYIPIVTKAIQLNSQVESYVSCPEHPGAAHVDELEVCYFELTRGPHIGQTDTVGIVVKVNQAMARGRGQRQGGPLKQQFR